MGLLFCLPMKCVIAYGVGAPGLLATREQPAVVQQHVQVHAHAEKLSFLQVMQQAAAYPMT